MTRKLGGRWIVLLCGAWLAAVASAGAQQSAPRTPAEQARADSGRPPYTRADVQFMQGMIGHHAQALVMAAMAATHGASADIRTLAGRIDVSQRDEIALMQRWLRERHEMVPDSAMGHAMPRHDMAGHDSSHHAMAANDTAHHEMAGHDMAAMHHDSSSMLMPGMLTPAQLTQLDGARGAEFDRLFLRFMIQHHQGALTMVEHLFASPGAGQEGNVFRFASDVTADQTTEIERMQRMLSARGA